MASAGVSTEDVTSRCTLKSSEWCKSPQSWLLLHRFTQEWCGLGIRIVKSCQVTPVYRKVQTTSLLTVEVLAQATKLRESERAQ